MTQPAPVDTGLRVPLSASVWTAPGTVYKWDASVHFGVFAGTKGAAIYAPETGMLLILKDRSWSLKRDIIKDGRQVGSREWVGVSIINPADGVKNGQLVNAGQLIGVAAEDFALGLIQGITIEGSEGGGLLENTSRLDPVPFLLMGGAKFVQDPRKAQERKTTGATAHAPQASEPHAQQAPAELATTNTTEIAAPKERTFRPGHLVAVGVVSAGVGALVAYNLRRR